MEAWRRLILGGEKPFASEKEQRIRLTPTGLFMEGDCMRVRLLFASFERLSLHRDFSATTRRIRNRDRLVGVLFREWFDPTKEAQYAFSGQRFSRSRCVGCSESSTFGVEGSSFG